MLFVGWSFSLFTFGSLTVFLFCFLLESTKQFLRAGGLQIAPVPVCSDVCITYRYWYIDQMNVASDTKIKIHAARGPDARTNEMPV